MTSLQSITENLARAEKQFLAAADTVPADQWNCCPAENRWSAGELVCHLIQVESAIVKNASRVLRHPPKPRPFSHRFHLPMVLVESRLIPRKTPIPLDFTQIREKDEMLALLREVRQQTRVFMEECAGKPLRKYHMPHPFLGTFNLYEWFQVIASHQVRHSKQMREIAAALPKTVTAPQK
ncbi:MAG TPA: DinB family protein [Candidatus Acidoferrum sp.]|nr:DinB family protein [Candidatus Acidoferrum sp.]